MGSSFKLQKVGNAKKRASLAGIFLVLIIVVIALSGGHQPQNSQKTQTQSSNAPSAQPQQSSTALPVQSELPTQPIGVRTKTSGCIIANALPDKACSPGTVFANVTKDQVCISGYSSSVRAVSESTKNAVYAEYDITTHTSGQYEIDHLVSLELGGSNDIANLWPEAANPTPGFHQKDGLENSLHAKVCSGTMSLTTAQDEIASDWLAIYQGTIPTISSPQQTTQAPQPAATSEVVKLSTTGICHAPGTTYYDRTTNYTPFNTLQDCLSAGGRLPKH